MQVAVRKRLSVEAIQILHGRRAMTQQPIVVGFDDSPASRQALVWALRTAERRHAEVLLVHASEPIRR